MAPESRLASRPHAAPAGFYALARGVLFDFDGTLVDSYPLIEATFSQVMRSHRLDEGARGRFRASRGLPLPEQMKQVEPDRWADLVATYRSVDSPQSARLFRGIPTLLRRLRRAGVRMGVVSCKRHALVEAELVAAGLRSAFDVIIGFEDVSPPKPAPDPLLAAMTRMGVTREQTLYVGDTMVDLETGRAARVRTVLAAWGLSAELRADFRNHPLWATRPCEVLGLVMGTSPNGNGRARRS